MRHPDQLVTQRQLLQHIWQAPVEIDTPLGPGHADAAYLRDARPDLED